MPSVPPIPVELWKQIPAHCPRRHPSLKRSPPKPPSTKKAGGQHGHAKAQRDLHDLPDHVLEYKPTACRHCRQPLHGDDPQPLRHQVWVIPPLRPVVVEYRRRLR